MSVMGEMYKTTKNFMYGDYVEKLSSHMICEFDEAYNKVKSW